MAKRLKYKTLNYIPIAYNFSEVFTDTTTTDEDGDGFDVSDMSGETDKLYDQLALEQMIVDIMYNLTDREKVIFMYQLLRNDGYNIDHKSCAKTLHINRQWYMSNLSQIRKKVEIIIRERKRTK